jgi:DNA-directed RNA polymerase specialized sigma24 family protein
MQEMLPLSTLFKQYTLGILRKKELEGLIFQYILEHYQHFHLYKWNKDECADYLCWLYPRLSRAIENYRETGSSFDAYIRSIVHWSAREYRFREADHHITEYACWDAQAMDMMACGPEPEYSENPPVFKPVPNPRQVLILLLKSYYFISEDFISRIAPAIGVKKEKLLLLIDELRKRRLERDEEIRTLQERIHTQYYRCLTLTKRINAAPEGSVFRERMEQCRDRAKIRLEKMRKRLAAIRLEASNRQVAEVLGVPKGTVDSNLHAIKSKWKRAEKNLSEPG